MRKEGYDVVRKPQAVSSKTGPGLSNYDPKHATLCEKVPPKINVIKVCVNDWHAQRPDLNPLENLEG